jgi:hypothetical protein
MRAMRGRPADQRLSDEQLIQQLAGGDGELGALGGVEGGKKRWVGTTRAQRQEAARKAVMVRWARAKGRRRDT